jgi:hypothetical protein
LIEALQIPDLRRRLSAPAMSTAVALIFASFFTGFAAYIYVSSWAHHLSAEIVTGVAHASPLPLPTE